MTKDKIQTIILRDNSVFGIVSASFMVENALTLDEVDEHLQVPDLGLELVHQLLLDAGRVDDLSDGRVDPLPELLGRQAAHVLVQVHVQLLDQLVDDHLSRRREG